MAGAGFTPEGERERWCSQRWCSQAASSPPGGYTPASSRLAPCPLAAGPAGHQPEVGRGCSRPMLLPHPTHPTPLCPHVQAQEHGEQPEETAHDSCGPPPHTPSSTHARTPPHTFIPSPASSLPPTGPGARGPARGGCERGRHPPGALPPEKGTGGGWRGGAPPPPPSRTPAPRAGASSVCRTCTLCCC